MRYEKKENTIDYEKYAKISIEKTKMESVKTDAIKKARIYNEFGGKYWEHFLKKEGIEEKKEGFYQEEEVIFFCVEKLFFMILSLDEIHKKRKVFKKKRL